MKRHLRTCEILLITTVLLITITGLCYSQEEKVGIDKKTEKIKGQEIQTERRVIKFSDPLKPGLLHVDILRGDITIRGYNGNEVIIEAKINPMKRVRIERGERFVELEEYEEEEDLYHEQERMEKKKHKTEGMKKLHSSTAGFEIIEENNVMRVDAEALSGYIDLMIQVPFNTSLNLDCIANGAIKVNQVNGEIEVDNINGPITLNSVSGTVVVNSVGNDIIATFTEVKPGKIMAFSSVSGHIDITLPKTVKATLKMKTDHGEVYSDFDIRLEQKTEKKEEDARERGGRYRLRLESFLQGTINGGGTEIQIETYSGDIYVRKRK